MTQPGPLPEASPAEHPHPGPGDVAQFVAGTLPRQQSRKLLRHLLRGCPLCSAAVAQCMAMPPAGQPRAAPGADAAAGADGQGVSQAVARIGDVAAARAEAVSVLTSLLAGERPLHDLTGGEVAALRGLPQLDTLLSTGFALRHHDPQETLRLAHLARCAADRLRVKELGAAPVADLRALAWAQLGNAHRICNDLPHASQALNRAVYWSRRGSRTGLLLARVADFLASLLGAQGRYAEARRILQAVHDTHLSEGRHHLAGRALYTAGCMAGWDGDAGRAIVLMRRGFDLLDLDRDPTLTVTLIHGMITHLAELGRFRSARRLLWRCRSLVVEQGNAVSLVRLRWLEGRIHAGLGDFARAEPALRETRAGFAEHGQIYLAAMAGLDLAALWARQGRLAEIHALAGEIIATFRAMRVAREAIVTLLILQKACMAGGGQLLDIIEIVVTFLKSLERQPAKRAEGA
jgi:tetratricopeptide (TPR) repeat protein